MNFQSATHAEIEEPYTPVNKDLYPDRYQAWKDSVWQSIKHWGTPLDYNQSFTASYQVPLDKLPIFDWLKTDASYSASYSWLRGTELDDGTSLGNTISNNRNLNINGSLNMETLYNHIPFLKKTNERFKKQPAKQTAKKTTAKDAKAKAKDTKKDADGKDGNDDKKAKDEKSAKDQKKEAAQLAKSKNTFQKELTLLPDSQMVVQHSKKSKRLLVSAKSKDGKAVHVRWKAIDENKIKVWLTKDMIEEMEEKASRKAKKSKDAETDSLLADAQKADVADSTKKDAKPAPMQLKISVTPKEPLENQWWYNPAQQAARLLMMVRSVNISYRNQHSMTLPGFTPNIGDAFGQRSGGLLAPGLDFAFGLVGDGYIDKALDRGWLLCNESVATPSTSSNTEDLQVKMTLEPVRDLKIDLNASRTANQAKSVQFMYAGTPTTYSGTFNMTTISIKSALEGMGDANNGYQSKSFDEFCNKIEDFRNRVQAQYPSTAGAVDPYSADVMVPAFLSTYTLGGSKSLSIFPAITRLLPNWTMRYAGLSKIPWFSEHFKSVNLNHSYKSVYSVGSYASYSSWVEYMGDLGYVSAADGSLVPSSRFNVSTVSINESFSPLLGVDVTLQNNMTLKMEYKTSRVLNLSMTSVQINESKSKDWVFGIGYKLQDFKLFGNNTSRKIKKAQSGKGKNQNNQQQQSQQNTRSRSGVNQDLNLRLDISLRKQAAITRDIASRVSSASSGNTAFQLKFAADYTLSRFLTLTAYYDRQTNTPLLSSSSYPTTTQDFGLSMKFSLTR